jgi:enoyl-CoA hydratase/carnithine racemase
MSLVEYDLKEKLAYITLNRPEKLNSVNLEMFNEWVAAFKQYDEDPDAWVAILSGRGRSFCAGHDQTEHSPIAVDDLFMQILNLKKPLIIAVQGHCVGMALAVAFSSDIRIAAENAKFGWPNVRWGMSSVGGPAFLPHYLPRNIGYEYLFTGELFSTEDAYRFGMVNRVVPQDNLMPTAEEIAHKILKNAPLAVRAMKESTLAGLELPLVERLRVSKGIVARVSETEDAKEGVLAFIEKREPVWKGE